MYLEVTPNFYALRFTLYASKISINQLVEKLLLKCWWNWPSISANLLINKNELADDPDRNNFDFKNSYL